MLRADRNLGGDRPLGFAIRSLSRVPTSMPTAPTTGDAPVRMISEPAAVAGLPLITAGGSPSAVFPPLGWVISAGPDVPTVSHRVVLDAWLVELGVLATPPRITAAQEGDSRIEYRILSVGGGLTADDALRAVGIAYGLHPDRLRHLLAEHRLGYLQILAGLGCGRPRHRRAPASPSSADAVHMAR